MQWDAQFLCTVDMRKTRRVCNNGMGNEGCLFHTTLRLVAAFFARFFSIGTRFPTTLEDLSYSSPPPSHFTVFQRLHPWEETRVLNHKGHQLRGVATNFKELQSIFLNKFLKRAVGCQADAVAILAFQLTAEGNEGLDISSRANDLDYHVEGWWRCARGAY